MYAASVYFLVLWGNTFRHIYLFQESFVDKKNNFLKRLMVYNIDVRRIIIFKGHYTCTK